MALPVAQLGSMPSLNTPSGGGHYEVRNPWEDLAMQVLAGAVTQGVGNLMSRDYTQQAQQEGLPIDATAEAAPWWKKALMGPTTDSKQFGQLRGEQAQTQRAALSESSADKRSAAQLAATREEGEATRRNQRELQGAAHVAEAARQFAGFGHERGLQNERLNFGTASQQAGFAHDLAMQEARNTAAMQELDKRIAAEEAQLGRRLTANEKEAVMQAVIGQVGRITTSANPAGDQMMNQMFQEQGLPPVPTTDMKIDTLMEQLRRLGYPVPGAVQ